MEKVFLHSKNESAVRSECLFSLDNVSVNFGSICALDNVSLSLVKNEILFVTGVSGAGKSTLLNLIAGEIQPSKGKLLKSNQNIFVTSVFQDLRLLEQSSIENNLFISYDPSLYGSKNIFYQELSELAKILGVYDFLNLKIKDANGGLRQKVAMIRALLAKPNLLLADEPSSALDRESTFKMFELLNYYNTKRGLTLVWASHNKDLVKQLPGKIAHLDKGKLIYSGHACFI
jgi:cell division transport system ATP-binding protein